MAAPTITAQIINLTQTLLGRPTLNIDSTQVYIVGLSSGGALSLLLGCEAPDLFRRRGAIVGPSVESLQFGATGFVPSTTHSAITWGSQHAI
jgi:poly(3-hydroxybutyrate) depolymerase